jgi:hypothetical protein
MITVLYVPAEGFAYRDASGMLTGVTVQIVHEFTRWVRDAQGVELSTRFVEEPDWRTFYGRVRDAEGGVFGLGNVTITEARRAELGFTPPYLTSFPVLITHAEVPEIAGIEEVATRFRGLTPLAFGGTLHEARLRTLRDAHLPGTAIETAASNAEILERVAQGRHFAYVDGYNYWRARAVGAPLRHHAVADGPQEEFGIIHPLSSDWGPPWDAFFAHEGGFRNSQAYRGILVEHLGEGLAEALEAARRPRP